MTFPICVLVSGRGTNLQAILDACASGSLDDVPGPGAAGWTATLALTRPQALRLIQAQNFAREVRLIPHGG